MGERNSWSILKGLAPAEARAAIDEAVAALPGPRPATLASSRTELSTRTLWAVCGRDTLTLCDDAWRLAQEIAAQRGLVEMELRIQEGDHWDFTLCRGRTVIADFSTRASYFDDPPSGPRPWKRGDAAVFIGAWGAAAGDVLPYLVDWDSLKRPRLATPRSRRPSGDIWEVLDFMVALGAANPSDHPERFEVRVPEWRTVYRAQGQG